MIGERVYWSVRDPVASEKRYRELRHQLQEARAMDFGTLNRDVDVYVEHAGVVVALAYQPEQRGFAYSMGNYPTEKLLVAARWVALVRRPDGSIEEHEPKGLRFEEERVST